jgi:hypothetical protein
MKTISLLTTAAALVVAMAGPGNSAPRQRDSQPNSTFSTPSNASDAYGAYADDGRGNQFYWSDRSYRPGQNLPYPDRPYGAPDRD